MFRVLGLLTILIGCTPAFARPDENLFMRYGGEPDLYLGCQVLSLGDVDGDGLGDLSAGSYSAYSEFGPRHNTIWSSSGREILFFAPGLVAAIGDVNGDGLANVLVASGHESLHTRIFAFPPRTEIARLVLDPFPVSVAGLGDVDGDDLDDVALLATDGTLEILSVLDQRTLLSTVVHAEQIAPAGDVNGDGVPDLLAANSVDGVVHVLSGIDAATILRFEGEADGDHFGSSISSAGDVNGDGIPDLIISARVGRYFRVYSGSDGRVLFGVSDLESTFPGGDQVDGGEDWNGDGVPDFFHFSDGILQLFSGVDGTRLRKKVTLSDSRFAGIDDYDGDGCDDLLIGQPDQIIYHYAEGTIEVVSGNALSCGGAIEGTVNGSVTPKDVLFVNNRSQTPPCRREVRVALGRGIFIRLDAPPSLDFPNPILPFAIYAWAFPGERRPIVRNLRHGVGAMCFPSPLTHQRVQRGPMPQMVFDSIGAPRTLAPNGIEHVPVAPSPGVFYRNPDGFLRPGLVYLQGVVRDPASRHGQLGITNGIWVRVGLDE